MLAQAVLVQGPLGPLHAQAASDPDSAAIPGAWRHARMRIRCRCACFPALACGFGDAGRFAGDGRCRGQAPACGSGRGDPARRGRCRREPHVEVLGVAEGRAGCGGGQSQHGAISGRTGEAGRWSAGARAGQRLQGPSCQVARAGERCFNFPCAAIFAALLGFSINCLGSVCVPTRASGSGGGASSSTRRKIRWSRRCRPSPTTCAPPGGSRSEGGLRTMDARILRLRALQRQEHHVGVGRCLQALWTDTSASGTTTVGRQAKDEGGKTAHSTLHPRVASDQDGLAQRGLRQARSPPLELQDRCRYPQRPRGWCCTAADTSEPQSSGRFPRSAGEQQLKLACAQPGPQKRRRRDLQGPN